MVSSRKLLLLLCCVVVLWPAAACAQDSAFTSKSVDITVLGGVWLGGDVHLSYHDINIQKNPGVLAKLEIDGYLIDKLAMGVYATYSPFTVENATGTATVLEFGCAIKPRFMFKGGNVAIKPGLSIGYRMFTGDVPGNETVNAMAVNGSVEVQFNIHAAVMPVFEIGFLTQPVGGNDYTDVTFPPRVYLGAGIVF